MIARIAPLAVLSAIAPTTITAVLVILTGSKPIRLLVALYAGGMVASIALGYAIVVTLEGSGAFTGSGSSHVSPSIDVAAGALALALAAWLASGRRARRRERRAARRRGRPRHEPWSRRILARGSTPLIFATGVVLGLPGGMYLVALKDVAVSDPSTIVAIAAIVAFNLVMLTPIELPLVAALVNPEGTLARLRSFSGWLAAHGHRVMIAVTTIAGVYLVVRGVLGL